MLNSLQGFDKVQQLKSTPKYDSKITVIESNGVALPKNKYGHFLDKDYIPLSTNSDSIFINSDGQLLPTNSVREIQINYNVNNRILPTDDTGKFIYPIVYSDGSPLKIDASGNYVDLYGESLITDDFGRPLDEKGNLLPTNDYGQYIYAGKN